MCLYFLPWEFIPTVEHSLSCQHYPAPATWTPLRIGSHALAGYVVGVGFTCDAKMNDLDGLVKPS